MPIRFFDVPSLPTNLTFLILGWGIPFLWKKLIQKHPIKINREQIWRNYQWAKIGYRFFHLVGLAYLESFLSKIRIAKFNDRIYRAFRNDIYVGFRTFKELEPGVAYWIFQELEKFAIGMKVNEITGLEKYDFED